MDNKENIANLLKYYSECIGFDFNLVQNFEIINDLNPKEWEGKVNPINSNNNLYYELLLHQDVISNLYSGNKDKEKLAISIIQHELFHCKEMFITSKFLDWHTLYFHEPITSSRLLLFDTAFHQWSEYYAYYNSSKINEKEVKLHAYLSKADACLTVLYRELKENNLEDIQFIHSFIENLIDFIHTCIQLVAHYNSNHSKKYLRELNRYSRSKIYPYYYPYLKDLAYYMDKLYHTYPKWVSESSFMELGYKLFSFIKIYNLWFSSDNLSDNFILKEIK